MVVTVLPKAEDMASVRRPARHVVAGILSERPWLAIGIGHERCRGLTLTLTLNAGPQPWERKNQGLWWVGCCQLTCDGLNAAPAGSTGVFREACIRTSTLVRGTLPKSTTCWMAEFSRCTGLMRIYLIQSTSLFYLKL